jgi:hypothetical protein
MDQQKINNMLESSENGCQPADLLENGKVVEDEIREIEAAENVVNAMRFYRKYSMLKLKRQADAIRLIRKIMLFKENIFFKI